jgi:hypothetical protein
VCIAKRLCDYALLTNYSQFSSPVIKIIVGNPECDAHDAPQLQTFFAHKDALISNSPFFAKAMSNYEPDCPNTLAAWVEAETGVIKLPEDKPEVFANYLELVYRGTTPSFNAPDSANLQKDAYNAEFKTRVWKYQTSLCCLYVFAEKVQDIAAKRVLLAAMVESTNLENKDGTRYLPIHEQVNVIYSGIPSSDPMRGFLTDCHVSFGRKDWPKASLYHPEFLDELLASIWRQRPSPSEEFRNKVRVASVYVQKLKEYEDSKEKAHRGEGAQKLGTSQ